METDESQSMTDPQGLPGVVPEACSDAGELANAVTHGIGLALSVAGAVLLIARALRSDAWRVVGCSIFAATLIAVYTASTLSHLSAKDPFRRWFRSLDQASIYLLIVGSSTPFALAYLRDGWWPVVMGLMWVLAFWGAASKILFNHRIDRVAIYLYVLLGWMPILFTPWLVGVIPSAALRWMLIGGVFYTAGTLFLARDRRYPSFHAIWHVFVIAGSACQYYAIFTFVAGLPSHAG